MNQKASTHPTSSTASRVRREQPDPFRFGWRYVRKPGANGTSELERVPLTPEDVLHPKWGDQIPEPTYQERARRYIASVLNYWLAYRPHLLVLSDCLVGWGVKGLRDHSPDISVFDGVKDRNRNRKRLSVRRERAWPLMTLEVVSVDPYDRKLRDNDVVVKVKEYFRAGVPLYVIIDQDELDTPHRLLGYQRGSRKYEAMPLDDQGRLRLESVGLLLGLRDDFPVFFDIATGNAIDDYPEMAQARQAAEAALAAAQARIQELEAQVQRRSRSKPPRSNHE